MIGTVKWYKVEKGYGFITPDDGSKDVFVHASDLQKANIKSLSPEQRVEFVSVAGNSGKGNQAINIRII